MKKLFSLICTIVLIVSLTGCETTKDNSTNSTADYSNSTLTGQVISIEATAVTLQLGELTEQVFDSSMENSTKPSGDGVGEAPDGEMPTDREMPTEGEIPTGDAPSDNARIGDETGDIPDGELPSRKGSGGAMGGAMTEFTAGEETVTLDLDGASFLIESGSKSTEDSLSDIAVDDVLVIEIGDGNTVTSVTVKDLGGKMGGMGEQTGFGGFSDVTQGTSANTIAEDGDYSDTTYTSDGDDENALRVVDATVILDGITVNKSGGATSNTEDGDFYGMNAGLLATDEADVTIINTTVTTSAQNGNGVFSYGDGTVVTISNSNITTTADNSGGIQTTGGATMNANNLTVSTAGSSSAAIRSDRGGGTVIVDSGSYTSSGYNSPAVYSTADITVSDAILTAENSEALIIEGHNSMSLIDCDATGNMSDTQGTSSDENVHNVMIYQSMSGDANVGTSSFSMTGGSLTNNNGDLFFVTNTHCLLTLSGVNIVNKETDGYLLLVTGNSASHGWGTAGANGAQVQFTADEQTLEGDIAVDTISTLDMVLTNGSVLTGTINIIENAENGTAVDNNAVVTIDEDCIWNLTDNCTITSLTNSGTINYNGYTITLSDGSVLEG